MNQPQIFNFEQNEIRSFLENGIPHFVANDVAKALGYKNPSKATNDHCKKAIEAWGNDSLGRRQKFKIIPEPDVYRLIIKSSLPTAQKFEAWIMEEVLPTIRKNGMYATDELLNNPDLLIEVAAKLKEERAGRLLAEQQVTELQPKALFADSVSASYTSILVGDLAKLIKQNGVDIGARRLFEWLREKGFLIKRKGTDWNMPTQKSMDLGLFEVKETVVSHSDGHTSINKTPKVTGKGQVYFVNKFLDIKTKGR